MRCTSCSCGKPATADSPPEGCGSKGACSSGTCDRLNTYDWLAAVHLPKSTEEFDIVEVSFKNGSRKSFFKKTTYLPAVTGDYVLVESYSGGYDIGKISLMGALVRLQMKKRRVNNQALIPHIIRRANWRDLERMAEARAAEQETIVRARAIAKSLGLKMKIGDVEYQGDRRKVIFYYTAEGRVDFRELIRIYAMEFKVKIEMRQIGMRQEAARLGGIGTCGRELCCSTWLTDFKSVSAIATRYQNLAINQTKLAGQCGRLKCCLNYELNTYFDALRDFPRNVDKLKTRQGEAALIKTDIFKRIMYFEIKNKETGSLEIKKLSVEQVKMVWELNQKGIIPKDLRGSKTHLEQLPVVAARKTGTIESTFDKVETKSDGQTKQRKKTELNASLRPSTKPTESLTRNKKLGTRVNKSFKRKKQQPISVNKPNHSKKVQNAEQQPEPAPKQTKRFKKKNNRPKKPK